MAELSKRIQFILGATGTGKSSLALSVAKKLQAVILNGDSVQFYKHVQIGANKPSSEELKSCPHELFDVFDFPEEATASDYIEKAVEVLSSYPKQKEFLLVGGSGFYIQALEKGMFDVSPIPEETRKKVQEIEASGQTLNELKRLDPEAAKNIHPNDHYRLQRALQIVLSEGRSLEEVRRSTRENQVSPIKDFKVKKLGLYLEKEELRSIIEKRTAQMLAAGLVEETEHILKRNFKGWAPLKSIGYQECVQFLEAQLPKEDLAPAIVKNTMSLAKRQQTWFKRDPEIKWFHGIHELQEAREYLIIAP